MKMLRSWLLTVLVGLAVGTPYSHLAQDLAQATVNEVSAADRYTGNGTTTVFTYTFKILVNTDIEVIVDGTTKTLTTDYTVSGVGSSGGGSVTMVSAPASGKNVTLLRKQPVKQASTYTTNEAFPSARVEKDFDKQAMIDQQQNEALTRTIRAKKEEGLDMILPAVASRKSKVLGFDSTGLPQAISSLDQSAQTVTAANSTTARTLASRFADIMNAKDFGVTGDGTDETTLLQAAIDVATTHGYQTALDLGGMTIGVTKINVKTNVVLINGTLKAKSSTQMNCIVSFDSVTDAGLSRVKIDGVSSASSVGVGVAGYRQMGICIQNDSQRIELDHAWLHDVYWVGVLITCGQHIKSTNLLVETGIAYEAIWTGTPKAAAGEAAYSLLTDRAGDAACTIEDVTFTATTVKNIQLEGVGHWREVGSTGTVRNIKYDGLTVINPGISIGGSTAHAFWCSQSVTDISVTNYFFDGQQTGATVSSSGFHLEGCKGINIGKGTVKRMGESGITFSTTENVTVSGMDSYLNRSRGLIFEPANTQKNVTITDSQFHENVANNMWLCGTNVHVSNVLAWDAGNTYSGIITICSGAIFHTGRFDNVKSFNSGTGVQDYGLDISDNVKDTFICNSTFTGDVSNVTLSNSIAYVHGCGLPLTGQLKETNAAATDYNKILLHAPGNSLGINGYVITRAYVGFAASIAQDATDNNTYTLRKYDNTGTVIGAPCTLVTNNTLTLNFLNYVGRDLGAVERTCATVSPDTNLVLQRTHANAGKAETLGFYQLDGFTF